MMSLSDPECAIRETNNLFHGKKIDVARNQTALLQHNTKTSDKCCHNLRNITRIQTKLLCAVGTGKSTYTCPDEAVAQTQTD